MRKLVLWITPYLESFRGQFGSNSHSHFTKHKPSPDERCWKWIFKWKKWEYIAISLLDKGDLRLWWTLDSIWYFPLLFGYIPPNYLIEIWKHEAKGYYWTLNNTYRHKHSSEHFGLYDFQLECKFLRTGTVSFSFVAFLVSFLILWEKKTL